MLGIELEKVEDDPKHDEISTVEKLLFSFASLEQLYLGSLVLEVRNLRVVSLELEKMIDCIHD